MKIHEKILELEEQLSDNCQEIVELNELLREWLTEYMNADGELQMYDDPLNKIRVKTEMYFNKEGGR